MPRYDEVTQRAGSLRAMTGLTEPEFTALLPHFERALAASLQDRTIDGQPRTSRRDSAYDNCPLPTMADKLLFILTDTVGEPISPPTKPRFSQGLLQASVPSEGSCVRRNFGAFEFANSIPPLSEMPPGVACLVAWAKAFKITMPHKKTKSADAPQSVDEGCDVYI
jgi:hypothetical protein